MPQERDEGSEGGSVGVGVPALFFFFHLLEGAKFWQLVTRTTINKPQVIRPAVSLQHASLGHTKKGWTHFSIFSISFQLRRG